MMKRGMKKKTGSEGGRKKISILLLMLLILLVLVALGFVAKKKTIDSKEIQDIPITKNMREVEEEIEISVEEEFSSEDREEIIARPKVTVGDILSLLLERKGDGVEYTLIEIEGREVNITGEAIEIMDVYRLERYLRDEDAERINSDYIKKEGDKILFKMDFSLENYGKDKKELYIPDGRRIFPSPTEQRAILKDMIEKRGMEIISISRSQKREFSEGVTEVGIPYQIKGEIYNLVNLLLDLEENRVFLSLMESPIKIIIDGDSVEVYFKVTGYSGSFS